MPSFGPTRTRLAAVYGVLGALLIVGVAAGLLVGPGSLTEAGLRAVYLDLRATRVVAAFLIGAALAVGGVAVQSLFRNPLASPSILGTTAGASLGGQLALLALALGRTTPWARWLPPDLALPAGSLMGALVSLFVVLVFARRERGPVTLVLVGFVLSSLFLSLGAFITSLAQESWDLGRAIVAFTLGGLGGVSHRAIAVALPLVLIGSAALFSWGASLDLLLTGEDEATTLGLDVRLVRGATITWVAVLTAAAVALGGNVGFVGLVVPHALRSWVGPLHRRLMPAAALGGGVFVVACEATSRAFPSRAEIPLGVVTGLVGAPLFLVLVMRARRELDHG